MAMKPVLDAVYDAQIAFDESLQEEFASFSGLVNELREVFETSHPLMSRTYFVLQVESLMTKVHSSSSHMFDFLKGSDQFLHDKLSTAPLEYCLQKIKHWELDQTSTVIRRAMRNMGDTSGPELECVVKITDSLSLKSNQELLIEAVALENLKANVEQSDNKGEVNYLDQLLALVTYMQEQFVLLKLSESYNTVHIPANVCCPLWFKLGLTVCPKTRQTLAHTNLIPNYIAKALITNWCESNGVKLPESVKSIKLNLHSSLLNHATSGAAFDPHMAQLRNNQFTLSDSTQTLGCLEECLTNNGEIVPPSHPHSSLEDPESVNGRVLGLDSLSSPAGETRTIISDVETHIKKMVEDLKCTSMEVKRDATAELQDMKTQENAVTALLNLSINDDSKAAIVSADAIEPLIHVLESGTDEAKENSAATFFSLSVNKENRVMIGKSRVIQPLVDLLGNGTLRGKTDAATALYNLSMFHKNMVKIVQAGAVKYLVELMDPAAGMVDKAIVLLSNLATIPEGRSAIVDEWGIPVLVEVTPEYDVLALASQSDLADKGAAPVEEMRSLVVP
ncbi:hypothetical protein ACET3Z_014135 [Daucus carota]